MPCPPSRWMTLCVILSLSSAAAGCTQHSQIAVDSFCQLYNPVVTAKGDGAITATIGVKKKLLANELTYRKLCK